MSVAGGDYSASRVLTVGVSLATQVLHQLGAAGKEATTGGASTHLLLAVTPHVLPQLVLALQHHVAACNEPRATAVGRTGGKAQGKLLLEPPFLAVHSNLHLLQSSKRGIHRACKPLQTANGMQIFCS